MCAVWKQIHYSFLMSQKSSCFAVAWDLAPCPHSQCLFRYVLLMPTKFSCLAAAWDLAPCPHFHYLPNDLLHHQAGDRKGKVSNFRWLWDRKIGSGILSSSAPLCQMQDEEVTSRARRELCATFLRRHQRSQTRKLASLTSTSHNLTLSFKV